MVAEKFISYAEYEQRKTLREVIFEEGLEGIVFSPDKDLRNAYLIDSKGLYVDNNEICMEIIYLPRYKNSKLVKLKHHLSDIEVFSEEVLEIFPDLSIYLNEFDRFILPWNY